MRQIGLEIQILNKQELVNIDTLIKKIETNGIKLELKESNTISQLLEQIKSKVSEIETQMKNMGTNLGGTKVGSALDESLDRTKRKIKEVEEAKKELLNSKTANSQIDVGQELKSYDALENRMNEIKNSMQEITSIKMTNNQMGELNKAVITYKNNLGQTVTETMRLQQVIDSSGNINTVFKTSDVRTNDNIEKQANQVENLQEKYNKLKTIAFQLEQSGLFSNARMNSTVFKYFENIDYNNITNYTKELKKLEERLNTTVGNAKKLQELNKLKGDIKLRFEGINNTETYSKLPEELKKQFADAQKQLDVFIRKFKDNTQNINQFQLKDVIEGYVESFKKLETASSSLEKIGTKVKETKQSLMTLLNSKDLTGVAPQAIESFINRINSISTDTSIQEIRELKAEINNFGKNSSQIETVRTTIERLETNLKNLRGKYGNLVGAKNTSAELGDLERKIIKLKELLSSLQSGKTYDGAIIRNANNTASESFKKLKSAVENNSRALKLGQQNVMSFSAKTENSLNENLDKTREKINEVAKAKKELLNSKTANSQIDVDQKLKSYNALEARMNEIKNSMQEITNIKMSNNSMGELNKAVITYKNNLGQTVVETMKLQNIIDSTGNIRTVFQTSDVRTNDNIKQQSTQIENLQEKYKNLKTIATQLEQTGLFSNTKMNNTVWKQFEKIDYNNITNYTKELKKLESKINTTVANAKKLQELNKIKGDINLKFKGIQNTESYSKLPENLKKQFAEAQKEFDIFAKKFKDNTQNINKIKLNDVINEYVKSFNKLETASKSLEKLGAKAEETKSRLNKSLGSKNLFGISPEVIENLKNRINSITTDTSIQEIRELELEISKLGKNSGHIESVRKTISGLEENLKNLKGKYGNLVGDQNTITQLNDLKKQISELKQLLNSLQSGKTYDGTKIRNANNTATESFKRLKGAVENNSNALKLGQQNAIGFRDAISRTFSKIGIYTSVSFFTMRVFREFKEGIKAIKEIDDALRDLKRVSDEVSDSVIKNFSSVANKMAISLGVATTDVINATTEFKKIGYSFEESQKLAEKATILQNVGDISIDESVDAITSTLKGFNMEANRATEITDKLNEVGNNFAIGTGDIATALKTASAPLALANNDLSQTIALITTANEVMQDSAQVANGFRTISMRLRGVSEDGEELDANLGSMIKKYTGVDIIDFNTGGFRSTYDILLDISKVYDQLEDKQQALLLEKIAGKNRANVLASLFQNADKLEEVYDVANNSAGSALKEQEAYMDSISGKMNALSESFKGLFIQSIDSSSIKIILSGLTGIVNIVSASINTFGGLGTSITTIIGLLVMFNNRFREINATILKSIPVFSNISIKMNNYKKELKRVIDHERKYKEYLIATTKVQKDSEISVANFSREMTKANARIGMATLKLNAFKIACVATQAVMSMGLSLVISGFISGIESFCSSLTRGTELSEGAKEALSELKEQFEAFKQTSIDIDKFEELNKKLKEGNLSEEKKVEIQEELKTLKESLYEVDEEIYSVINNQTLSLERQIEILKQINEAKLKRKGEKLDDELGNGFWGQDQEKIVEKAYNDLKRHSKTYNEIVALQRQSGSDTVLHESLGYVDSSYLKILEEKMEEARTVVEEYNSEVKQIKDSGAKTDRKIFNISPEIISLIEGFGKVNQATDKNAIMIEHLKEKYKSLQTAMQGAIEESTNIYKTSLEDSEKIYNILNQINESQALTPSIIRESLELYPEMGSAVMNITTLQEFLNKKISEQEEIQRKAYIDMMSNDKNFFDTKIKNTQNWESFNAEVLNILSRMNNEYYNSNAEGMKQELSNAQTLGQARLSVEKKVIESCSKAWSQYWSSLAMSVKSIDGSTLYDNPYDSYGQVKEGTNANGVKYSDIVAKLQQQLRLSSQLQQTANKLNEGVSIEMPSFSQADFSSSSSGSSSSEKDYTVENLTLNDYIDNTYRLDKAIKDVQHNQDILSKKIESTYGKERLKYQKQYIGELQKEKNLTQSLINTNKSDLWGN